MKDADKRRRKLERPLIRTLPDTDTVDVFTPVHQEHLDTVCKSGFNVAAQGQEFIATSSDEWWLEVYGLGNKGSAAAFDLDSVSDISDDAVIPNKTREPLWRAVPRDPERNLLGNITFLAPDVIGLVMLETNPAAVRIWNVRTGQHLGSIALRGEYCYYAICRISDTEFVVGCSDGHLFGFEHDQGRNVRETSRVWKAHADLISVVSFNNGTILTTSEDRSARLWDAHTKKRLAILYHDDKVMNGAISDQYIITCSRYGRSHWENSELRIYRNCEGYPLVKILRTREGIFYLTLLDGGRVLCIVAGRTDEEGRPLVRHTLAVIDFENELMLAKLKLGCRCIVWYEVLSDGRLAAIGSGGCGGVIATLPRRLKELIGPKAAVMRRRRMCTLM